MSTTPRTDAACGEIAVGRYPDGSSRVELMVDADFARQLETELAEARKELTAAKELLAEQWRKDNDGLICRFSSDPETGAMTVIPSLPNAQAAVEAAINERMKQQ